MEIGGRWRRWSGQRKIHSGKLALRPRHEGGGNSVYKSSVPRSLDTRPDPEREAWVAKEWTESPEGVSNYLVRSCLKCVVRMETTSGLGIFGLALLGPHTNEIRHEEAGGWSG